MFELVDSAQHAADCALQHGQRILEAQEKAPVQMQWGGRSMSRTNRFLTRKARSAVGAKDRSKGPPRDPFSLLRLQDSKMLHRFQVPRLQDASNLDLEINDSHGCVRP